MKLRKAIKHIAAVGALAAVASNVSAVPVQGTTGYTSTGSLDITLNVNDEVKISNLSDVTMDFTGSDPTTGTSSACIYRNSATAYSVVATGDGAGNAFTLTNGTDTFAYEVFWDDEDGSDQLTSGSAHSADNAFGTDNDCATRPGGDNVSITISVDASDVTSLPADSYIGTLTLLVSPN